MGLAPWCGKDRSAIRPEGRRDVTSVITATATELAAPLSSPTANATVRYRGGMRTPEYSDDQLAAGLAAAAAELGEPLTAASYDAWQRDHDTASPALLIRRFGSWNEACARAGVATNKTRSTTRRWSDEDVVASYAEVEATRVDRPLPYDVLVDRISHEVTCYQPVLKLCALYGTRVVNNPFWRIADDKFFNTALAARLGVSVPKTVVPSIRKPMSFSEK